MNIKSKIADPLEGISKNINTSNLLNLGNINKTASNIAKFSANATKAAALLLKKRSLFVNNQGETNFLFSVKLLHSFVNILPKSIKGMNISSLESLFKATEIVVSILDTILNYKKIIANNTLGLCLVKILFEFSKIFNVSLANRLIFNSLINTQFKSLIGPTTFVVWQMYCYFLDKKPQKWTSLEMHQVKYQGQHWIIFLIKKFK